MDKIYRIVWAFNSRATSTILNILLILSKIPHLSISDWPLIHLP